MQNTLPRLTSGFTGWLRVDGSDDWVQMCSAATWTQCWNLLLKVQVDHQHVERLVTCGGDPNRRKREKSP